MKLYTATKSINGIAVLALIVAQCVFASSVDGRDARDVHGPVSVFPLNNLSVLGDFDGDRLLDRAELHLAGSHHCIRVRFGDRRESHLDFPTVSQPRGSLLARDINHDDKLDLIWISHYQAEAPAAWMGDGRGHFARAADGSVDSSLRSLLFGNSDPGILGDVKDEQLYLTPVPVSSDLARTASLEAEIHKVPSIAGCNSRRDLLLYLSYLRERGPPSQTPFA